MNDTVLNLLIFLFLMAVGYICGSWNERRHYRAIEQREQAFLHLPALTLRGRDINADEVAHAEMVYGSVVVSIDYFKRFLAILRNIFGGAVKSYESLIDRARREALLRMKDAAPQGTDFIVNVRVETAAIGKSTQKKVLGAVEVLAYGTAIRLREK